MMRVIVLIFQSLILQLACRSDWHISLLRNILCQSGFKAGPAAQYSIQEIQANASIAGISLAYLLHFDKPDSLTIHTVREFPLARYAAEYWTQHARVAGRNTSAIYPLVMKLFLSAQDAYFNWIRLCSLEEQWGEPDIKMSLEKVPSPLYYVSREGLIEFVRPLLEVGADVNAEGGGYGNALQAASYGGHSQVVQRLLEAGANVNAEGGYHYNSALQAASIWGYDQVVRQLLEAGANVNVKGGLYGSALKAALARGHDSAVQRLLEAGADVNEGGGRNYGSALLVTSASGGQQGQQAQTRE